MPTYIGENKIVDRYLGDKFLEAAYIGDEKVYDPYIEITGYLPIIFKSRASVALKNYRIHGTSAGAGVETENIIVGIISSVNITQNGVIDPTTADAYECCIAPIENGKSYGLMTSLTENSTVYAFFDTYPTTNGRSYDSQRYVVRGARTVVIAPITGYLVIRGQKDYGKEMVIEGSTAPVSYIPPGYKIPILNTSQSGNLFDKNATDETKGYLNNRLLLSNGSIKANSEWIVSEYIHTFPETTYEVSGAYATAGTPSIAFYNSNKEFISAVEYNYEMPKTVVTPPLTAFMRASVVKARIDTAYIIGYYQSNYDLFVGDSKLYEDEYLDFVEQKIYRTILLTTHDNKDFITSDNKRFCVRRSNNG